MLKICLLSLQRKGLAECSSAVRQANFSCSFKMTKIHKHSHNYKVSWTKRDKNKCSKASLSMIKQRLALSLFTLQVQKVCLLSKTVFWAFVWFVDVHYVPRVCLDFVLCFWVHFISLKASVSFASLYNSNSDFYIDGTWEPLFLWVECRKCLRINRTVGSFVFCLFSFWLIEHFFNYIFCHPHEWVVFFWWINHLRRNKSTLLEKDMEKWVFMIPITTFAWHLL